MKKHVIAILVDNEFGALARIVELFSARGCNIESLNVSMINKEENMSRVTITTYAADKTVDLICKLLNRIVPVHRAAEITREQEYIDRELALVKIIGDEKRREEVLNLLDKYRSSIIDITQDAAVFEIIGSSATIDEVLEKLSVIKPDAICRTGIAAGFKGRKRLIDNEYLT